MSEEQITRSAAAAAKAARRAAIAVAPLPEPAVSEVVETAAELVEAAPEAVEAVTETVAEVVEAGPEAVETMIETATAETVEAAEPLVETVIAETEAVAAAVEEAVTEAVVDTVIDAVDAAPSAPEIVAAGSAFAAKAALKIQALSDASTALTLGVQEASRTWLAATQSGMKLQREGFKKLAACRTPLDLMTTQGELALRGLESVTETGEAIARASTKAIEDAGRALQA